MSHLVQRTRKHYYLVPQFYDSFYFSLFCEVLQMQICFVQPKIFYRKDLYDLSNLGGEGWGLDFLRGEGDWLFLFCCLLLFAFFCFFLFLFFVYLIFCSFRFFLPQLTIFNGKHCIESETSESDFVVNIKQYTRN